MSEIDIKPIKNYIKKSENKFYEKLKQKLSKNEKVEYQSLFDETDVANAKLTLILLGDKNE